MRLINLMVFLLLLTALFAGQQIREEKGADYDITKASQNLTWPELNVSDANTTVGRITLKTADAFGFIMFEIFRESMVFGFENPQYDFGFMIDLLITYLKFSIVIMVIPIGILFVAMSWALIVHTKEWVDERRPKQ